MINHRITKFVTVEAKSKDIDQLIEAVYQHLDRKDIPSIAGYSTNNDDTDGRTWVCVTIKLEREQR